MSEAKMVDPGFLEATVRRSAPNPNRPRLSTAVEDRLADLESRAAAQYASMESFEHNFKQLATLMDEEHAEATKDAVPETVTFEDSMVHNVEEVRAQLKGGTGIK